MYRDGAKYCGIIPAMFSFFFNQFRLCISLVSWPPPSFPLPSVWKSKESLTQNFAGNPDRNNGVSAWGLAQQ